MRKELKKDGRLNCASVVLEFKRGLMASMRISRPVSPVNISRAGSPRGNGHG